MIIGILLARNVKRCSLVYCYTSARVLTKKLTTLYVYVCVIKTDKKILYYECTKPTLNGAFSIVISLLLLNTYLNRNPTTFFAPMKIWR